MLAEYFTVLYIISVYLLFAKSVMFIISYCAGAGGKMGEVVVGRREYCLVNGPAGMTYIGIRLGPLPYSSLTHL